MNITALLKAIRFACLPTLSVLMVLFFGFFSITETLAFISSSNGWAIAIRIICMIGEIILIVYFYDKYRREEILSEGKTDGTGENLSYNTRLYDLFKDGETRHVQFFKYDTADSNIVIIERIYKNEY